MEWNRDLLLIGGFIALAFAGSGIWLWCVALCPHLCCGAPHCAHHAPDEDEEACHHFGEHCNCHVDTIMDGLVNNPT